MQIQYLEIVTKDVDAVCATYAQLHGVTFGDGDAGLGGARTAALPDGGLLGVRAPMHEAEEPVVRPYLLVDDVEAAARRLGAAGFDVSDVRSGAKPGTAVCTLRGEPAGVATLLIGPERPVC